VTRPPRETPDIETSTDDYAQRFSGPIGTWFLDVQWKNLCTLLRDCPGRNVLELGGGHAQLTGALLDCDYHTTVMGSDPACAHRLRPFLDHQRCSFQTGDLMNLPYADQSFDTVIALRLMAHIDDWPRLVAEACRVARYALILDYPSLVSVNRVEKLLFGVKKAIEKNTRWYKCYTTKMITEAGRSSGFEYSDRRRQFFMPMVVHRTLKRPKLSSTVESVCRQIGLTRTLGSPVMLKLSRRQTPQAPIGSITVQESAA